MGLKYRYNVVPVDYEPPAAAVPGPDVEAPAPGPDVPAAARSVEDLPLSGASLFGNPLVVVGMVLLAMLLFKK